MLSNCPDDEARLCARQYVGELAGDDERDERDAEARQRRMRRDRDDEDGASE